MGERPRRGCGAADFTPDSRGLVVSSDDGAVSVVDVETGDRLSTITAASRPGRVSLAPRT